MSQLSYMTTMSIRELPEELKIMIKDAQEDGNSLIEAVNYIIDWLKKQPHINARVEPQWIAAFLRGCKYSLERTKEKLDAYYTIRTHLPELFADRDPKQSKLQEFLDLGTCLPLPLTDKPDGTRVILIRGAIYDPKKFTFLDLMQVFFMILDIQLMEDDRLNLAGQDTVLDLTGSSLELVGQFTPSAAKKAITCFQDAYPIKTKSLHFFNVPPTFDAIFAIFKRFMSQKLRERIMVHSDANDLFKYIPKRVLPSDYGGDAPAIADLTRDWKKRVMEHRDWFIDDAQYHVTESKRPGKQISGMDLFGVDGSFRKLEFD